MHTKGDNENIPKGDNKNNIKNTNPKRQKEEENGRDTTKEKRWQSFQQHSYKERPKKERKGPQSFLYPIYSYRLIVIIFMSSY